MPKAHAASWSRCQRLLPRLHFMASMEPGQYLAVGGADAATTAVGCNATSLSTSNKKRGTKRHRQITAVLKSHEHLPGTLKAPWHKHSLRNQLRSDARTPWAPRRPQTPSAPAATAVRRCRVSSQPRSPPPHSPSPVHGDGGIGPSSTHALPEGQDESSLSIPLCTLPRSNPAAGLCHLRVFRQLQGWSQVVPICPWGPYLRSGPSHKHHPGAHS